jgi:hypothetical protein
MNDESRNHTFFSFIVDHSSFIIDHFEALRTIFAPHCNGHQGWVKPKRPPAVPFAAWEVSPVHAFHFHTATDRDLFLLWP